MPKSVHLIGICGSGMASLAGLFKAAGWEVTGSDTQCYPPMSEQLAALQIPVSIGFDPKNLPPVLDAVVIGNVCTRDNPEAQAALARRIPYYSLPQALQEFFLKEKKALVVAGTHGKTTTATLLAWVLTHAGLDPGFLVGGIGLNFGHSFHWGQGEYFVVEGDEYDSAFFDKNPKFTHYRPFGAILTSIEWDHVDIYPQFEKMIEAFRAFLQTLRPESLLLAWADGKIITELTQEHAYSLFRYGLTQGDYTPRQVNLPRTDVLAGPANLENALAVAGLCHRLGLPSEQIGQGIQTFQGVKKRQEVKGIVKEVTVIDDFAHHPTAVRRTIEALKEKYPGQRLIVVFEPRSNTSRRNAHYMEYLKAFKGASRVILAPLYHPETIPPAERLNTAKLADDLMRRGIDAYAIDDHEAIVEFILRSIGPKEVVAFFSNGDFGNIHAKLTDKLNRRKIYPDRHQVRSIKVKP